VSRTEVERETVLRELRQEPDRLDNLVDVPDTRRRPAAA
jgi:hypothetical protein